MAFVCDSYWIGEALQPTSTSVTVVICPLLSIQRFRGALLFVSSGNILLGITNKIKLIAV